MRWDSLFPFQFRPGDVWGGHDKRISETERVGVDSWVIVFDDGSKIEWPDRAPMRIGRDQ
jgi:hypothetical protein